MSRWWKVRGTRENGCEYTHSVSLSVDVARHGAWSLADATGRKVTLISPDGTLREPWRKGDPEPMQPAPYWAGKASRKACDALRKMRSARPLRPPRG